MTHRAHNCMYSCSMKTVLHSMSANLPAETVTRLHYALTWRTSRRRRGTLCHWTLPSVSTLPPLPGRSPRPAVSPGDIRICCSRDSRRQSPETAALSPTPREGSPCLPGEATEGQRSRREDLGCACATRHCYIAVYS